MKKCYRFLQYYLIKGFLTILEGNYEICMKSQSNFWQLSRISIRLHRFDGIRCSPIPKRGPQTSDQFVCGLLFTKYIWGENEKVYIALAWLSYQANFKNHRGQILNMYEIQKYYVYNLFTKKSRMAYWQTGTVGLYCNQNELALYAREC